MQQVIAHKEAVRLAKEKLGAVPSTDLAAYIQENFGLAIKPQIVTVLLGTFQERATLDQSGQAAYAKIAQWKTDNPEEAKKLAATVKRREAIRRKKEEKKAAATQMAEAQTTDPTIPANVAEEPTIEVAPQCNGGGVSAELPGLSLAPSQHFTAVTCTVGISDSVQQEKR